MSDQNTTAQASLNSENRELFRLISLEMQVHNQKLINHFNAELRAADERSERRTDQMESRVTAQLGEIKDEQRSMRESIQDLRDKQESQGGDIREIKARLAEGDRRMDELEEQQEELAEKDSSSNAAVALAGTGLGGAVTWAVMKLFGG